MDNNTWLPYSANLIRLYGTPIERHLSGLYACFINIGAKLRDRGGYTAFRAEILEIALLCYIASELLPSDEERELRIVEALAAAEEALHFLDAHPQILERIMPANGKGIFSADPEIDKALQLPYIKLMIQFKSRLKRVSEALLDNESATAAIENLEVVAGLYGEYEQLLQTHETELRAFFRQYVFGLPVTERAN
jgi:hypothetical protein